MNIFNSVLRDVFYGLPRPPAPQYHVTKELEDFEGVLLHYTKEKGLVAHHQWIVKINQLRNLSKIHHGRTLLSFDMFHMSENTVFQMVSISNQ